MTNPKAGPPRTKTSSFFHELSAGVARARVRPPRPTRCTAGS